MPARLCFSPDQSRGRRYPEPPHRYRNIYQRDRDRVVHARAFRRLEHKTQVFTSPDSDHFRNRLTHTIEVSQIARTVAVALGLNEDLVEALALAHDIGHPPFGHSGEDVLDELMRRFGDRFDHNLHALRIVESFEQRYAAFPGLNLTFEVREGLIKHSRDYDADAFPELREYLLDQRPLLEAQLIDPADEIAYNCADLDDGVGAGLLDVPTIRGEVVMFDRLMAQAARDYPTARPRQVFHETLRRVLNELVSGLITGTQRAVAEAGVETPQDVRECMHRLAKLTEEAAKASSELRSLLHRRVYDSPELALEREHSGEKVATLFAFFLDHPDRLPPDYREQTAGKPLHRTVCDYIAGMTDKFLLARYGELVRTGAL